MRGKKWTVVIPDHIQDEINRMTPKEVQDLNDVIDELSRNPYRGTPLCPGLLGWRWMWTKIQFIWHEIKRRT